MFENNWIALIAAFTLAILWLRINDFAAHRRWVSSALSRKIIHIGTGPIFVLSWLFFHDAPLARWMAALIPFAITIQFTLVGLGIIKDPSAVKAMSRSGDPKEILKGPLFYGIVFVVLTLVYWKDSPVGMIALMLLCGGDGLADIVGKRIPSRILPWSPRKTVAGSIAMFGGGWMFSFLITTIYSLVGVVVHSPASFLVPITIISMAGTIIESLPLSDLDNITVPAVAILMGHLMF